MMLAILDPKSIMLYTSFLKNEVLSIVLLIATDLSTRYKNPMVNKKLGMSS